MSAEFHKTLSALRHEKGVSQREAAATLGVSQALLSHYENGVREPGLRFLAEACAYYGVSADYLLGRTEFRRPLSFSGTGLGEIGLCLEACVALLSTVSTLEDAEQRENALSLLSAFFCALSPQKGERPGREVLLTALLNLRRAQLGAGLAEAGFDAPESLRRRTADELNTLFLGD